MAIKKAKSKYKYSFKQLVNHAKSCYKKYTMSKHYNENDVIAHFKFGVGVVRKSYENKIFVEFEDTTRTLMQAA